MSGLSESAAKRFPMVKDRVGMMQDTSPDSGALKVMGMAMNRAAAGVDRQDELQAESQKLSAKSGQMAQQRMSTLRARQRGGRRLLLSEDQTTLGG